jgi:hypothetical protein
MTGKIELNRALIEVESRRGIIVDKFRLGPDVFDSWLKAAGKGSVAPDNHQPFFVILAWIKGLPELAGAREVLLQATRPARTSDGWLGQADGTTANAEATSLSRSIPS